MSNAVCEDESTYPLSLRVTGLFALMISTRYVSTFSRSPQDILGFFTSQPQLFTAAEEHFSLGQFH